MRSVREWPAESRGIYEQHQRRHHKMTGTGWGWGSVYRQYHSTETVLLKVFSDLQLANDRGQVTPLCLLDLTAACDTVDHELLLQRLQRTYGISGSALAWFESYLSGRTYCMVVDSVLLSQVI